MPEGTPSQNMFTRKFSSQNAAFIRDNKQRSGLLVKFVIASIIICSGFSVSYYFFFAKAQFALIFSIAVPTLFLAIAVFYLSRSLYWGTIAYSGICSSIIAFAATVSGGVSSPLVYWLSVPGLIAGLIEGKKSSRVSCLLSLTAVGTIYVLGGFVHTSAMLMAASLILVIGFVTGYFLKVIEKQMNQLKAERNSSEQLLRVFCHDVVNPLTIIKGRSSDDKTVADHGKNLERIHSAAIRMQKIIAGIKIMADFDARGEKIPCAPVRIRAAIDEAWDSNRNLADDKEITLTISLGSLEDRSVVADSVYLSHQIFGNILSNAIKFSVRQSTIHIEGELLGNKVQLRISDSGIGIQQHRIGNLLTPESSFSTSGTEGERGTGFGLPIANTFIKKIGGKIKVVSRHNEDFKDDFGTTVHLSLVLDEKSGMFLRN